MMVPVLAAEGGLGALLAGDAVLLRREPGAPFGIGFFPGHGLLQEEFGDSGGSIIAAMKFFPDSAPGVAPLDPAVRAALA